MRSWTNYILGTDSRLFQNMAVRDARHSTDQYLVLGCLRGATPAAHLSYLGRRTRSPIRPPTTSDRVDRMFAKFQRAILRPPWRERHCKAWMSPETFCLINTRIAARRRKDQQISQVLSHDIKAGLLEERRRQAAEAGYAVESLLASDPPIIQEAWIRIRGWYKAAVDLPPPPERVSLATMTEERE